MKRGTGFALCLAVAGLILSYAQPVPADVSAGDVITTENWQKAEGLLPESVLNWVKKGEYILDIAEMECTPSDFFPPVAKKALADDVGRYSLDDESGIIDVKTGKEAKFIEGIPFPEIDPEDPKAAEKVMHNHQYMQYIIGNFHFNFQLQWVGKNGFEREVEAEWRGAPMTGSPQARDLRNPDNIEKYSLLVVKKPFDLAGTAIMTWRFLAANRQDNTFGYVPAIRRVRRMSPSNRSDTFVGSDECVDDANGYDGKVAAFDWKLLRVQDALMPYLDSKPIRAVKNEFGEWNTTKDVKKIVYGFDKPGWTGASWAPTNLVWIKRPAYVIEMTPKDPYYTYGTHYIWVDTETYAANYKIIYTRSGDYWKTLYVTDAFAESDDKSMQFIAVANHHILDEITGHATISELASPRNIWTIFADLDFNDFSLAGFQKYCK